MISVKSRYHKGAFDFFPILFIFANIGNQCLSIKKGYGKER